MKSNLKHKEIDRWRES